MCIIQNSFLILTQLDIFSGKFNAFQNFRWFMVKIFDKVHINFSTRKSLTEINKIKLTEMV